MEPKKIQDQQNPAAPVSEQPTTVDSQKEKLLDEKTAPVPSPSEKHEEKPPLSVAESSSPQQPETQSGRPTPENQAAEDPRSKQGEPITPDPTKKPNDQTDPQESKPKDSQTTGAQIEKNPDHPEAPSGREVSSTAPPEAGPKDSDKEPEPKMRQGAKQYPILNAETLRKLFRDEGRPVPAENPLPQKPTVQVTPIPIPAQPAVNPPSDRKADSTGPDSQRGKIPIGFTYGGPMKNGVLPMAEPGTIANPTAVRDGKVVPIDQVDTQRSASINIIPGPTQFPTNLEGNFAIVLDEKQAEKYFEWKKTSPNGDFQGFMDSLRRGPLNKENLRSPRSSRFLDLRGSNTSAPGALGSQGSGVKAIGRERIEPQSLNINFNANRPGDLNATNKSQPHGNTTQFSGTAIPGSLQSIPVQAVAPFINSLNPIATQQQKQEPKELNKKTVILPRPQMRPDPNQAPRENSQTTQSPAQLINNRPASEQQTYNPETSVQGNNPFELLGPYQPSQNPTPAQNSVTPLAQSHSPYGSPGTVPFAGSYPYQNQNGFPDIRGGVDQSSPSATPIEQYYLQNPAQQTLAYDGYQQHPANFQPNQFGSPAYYQQPQPPAPQNIFHLLGSG